MKSGPNSRWILISTLAFHLSCHFALEASDLSTTICCSALGERNILSCRRGCESDSHRRASGHDTAEGEGEGRWRCGPVHHWFPPLSFVV